MKIKPTLLLKIISLHFLLLMAACNAARPTIYYMRDVFEAKVRLEVLYDEKDIRYN